jgi:arylsulfatase A-like enzyme
VDDNVGRVLDYLDETGLAENTVVMYSSDQGFYLGDHGWFDKRFMYEESFRMPFLVRWPGVVQPGSESDALVSNLDFAETFLDIAGVEIPKDMQGVSLVPVLDGEVSGNSALWSTAQQHLRNMFPEGNPLIGFGSLQPDNWRKSLYYHYYEFEANRRTAHMVRRHYGVRTQRYKLIYFYNLDEWELYDLEKDPREMHSVYDDPAYHDIVARLKKEITRLQTLYKVPDDKGSVPKNPPSLQARRR